MLDSEFSALRSRVQAIVRPQPALFTYYLLTSAVLLCAAPLALVPLYFHYHTLWYRFTDEGVSMGHGILFRKELQLTYARMQDIHLSQNLLERWLGIGTLVVQTAGSGDGGNLRIVGVAHVEAIRDYLYMRMRGVRTEAPAEQPADALLAEIRDALNAAAASLSKRAG